VRVGAPARAAALAVAAAAGAAGADPAAEGDVPFALPDRFPPLTWAGEEACRTAGGQVVTAAGFLGGSFCAARAPDAGKACGRASDCVGLCLAETRTCQEYLNPYGCHTFLDDDGRVVGYCLD
jgi:hypothetical protein